MTALLLIALATAAQASPAANQADRPATPDCRQLLAAEPRPGVAQLCQAEDAMRLAGGASPESPERPQHLREAAALYDRAADLWARTSHRRRRSG